MKKTLAIIAFAIAAVAPSTARNHCLRFTTDTLDVTARLHLPVDSIGSDYALEYSPLLITESGDTLHLEHVIFRGPRNHKYVDRNRFFGTLPQATEAEYLAGSTVDFRASLLRIDYPELWDGKDIQFQMDREVEGCCDSRQLSPLYLGSIHYVEPFVPALSSVPDFTGRAGELQRDNSVLHHISEYKPYTPDRVLRKDKDALYVHFPLNSSEIQSDFRNNEPVLNSIIDITTQIMADTASEVKIIQVIGLASVEGRLSHNLALAGNRAKALKDYIQERVGAADALFEVANGGEAWTELRDQISDMEFDGRDQLLEIIDSEPDLDKREQRIRALNNGKAYAYLRDNVLSDQRNSGYLRIYYDYVPDIAAAEINAAIRMMNQDEDYAGALQRLLPYSSDPRAWSPMGVAYYMLDDLAQALHFTQLAADAGYQDAVENLKNLQKR